MSDEGTLRFLRELDEGTEWELPREMPSADAEDDSVADVSAGGNVYPISTLDEGESAGNILSCVGDMVKEGAVEDITVIVNTKEDEQFLFTTVNRNDLVIGMLEVAKMNWHKMQIWLQSTEEEE